MNTLNHKIDFALVFSVRNANPNGDPLDGNRPRTTYAGIGEVTDVCLKRKIRNRWIDEGYPVFVQSDDHRSDEFRSLKDRAEGCPALKECLDAIGKQNKNKKKKDEEDGKLLLTSDDYAKIACREWLDVRAFGQVFAYKSGDVKSVGVRGPVSIQSAFSLDTVTITDTQITKSVNLETNETDPSQKNSDTIGSKSRIDFGVYVTYGAINVQTAERTGFSQEDAEALKEALRTLFRNDASSARPDGSMEVVKLIWWEHNCESGQFSSAKVHRSLRVSVNEANEIKVDVDEAATPGLKAEITDGE